MQMGIPDPEEPDEAAAADHKRKGDIAFVGKRYQEALQSYSQSLRHKTSNHVVWAKMHWKMLDGPGRWMKAIPRYVLEGIMG